MKPITDLGDEELRYHLEFNTPGNIPIYPADDLDEEIRRRQEDAQQKKEWGERLQLYEN